MPLPNEQWVTDLDGPATKLANWVSEQLEAIKPTTEDYAAVEAERVASTVFYAAAIAKTSELSTPAERTAFFTQMTAAIEGYTAP